MKTILLVDDDRMILDAMYTRLTDEGFRVIPRDRPDEALHDLANNEVDLIISDFEMTPHMDGVKFGVEAAKLKPKVPFLMVTGHNGSRLWQYADEAGLECTIMGKLEGPKEVIAHARKMIEGAK